MSLKPRLVLPRGTPTPHEKTAVIHHVQRILGTGWPGVPGVAGNVRGVAAPGLPDDVLAGVLSGHAARVYLRS